MRMKSPLSRRALCRALCRALLLSPALAAAAPAFAEAPIAVRDSIGEVCFRAQPKRVVALQWDSLENLIALGVTPVGAADTAPWAQWVRSPALPPGIADVGTRAEPSLERIAALQPDLIVIGPSQRERLDVLRGIAPVLCFENHRAANPLGQAETALAQLFELARLFGREARARAIAGEIEEKLALYGREIHEAFGRAPEVQVVRFSSLTTLFLYAPNSIADYVVEKMGLRQPLRVPKADYGLRQARIRDLRHLESACVVYIRPFPMEKKLLSSILWQATPFARKGRVAAGVPYWSHGGALSILATAESIRGAMLEIAAREASPERRALSAQAASAELNS